MQKINYDLIFQKELETIQNNPLYSTRKPTILLHACCGPCSSYVLELLAKVFDISIYYYNPNIHPEQEYTRRLEELRTFLENTKNKNTYASNPTLLESEYNTNDYFNTIDFEANPELKTEHERGIRCEKCYRLRLTKSAQYAQEHNFDYFTTTLSISPHKDSNMINTIGSELEKEISPKYLFADFKKRNGYKRSLEYSTEFDLYRQDYCGCVFSKNNNKFSEISN